MATTITIDPVTRIEGHLEIEVTVDTVGQQQQVIDAKSAGTMFRGFEMIMAGRDPRDAAQLTQRICGVCPVSHAMAATMTLDDAFGVAPPANGRILRNLILGANFIQSHVLHFYHLAALDYIDTTGLLDMSPWTPRWITPDMATGTDAADLVAHYLVALEIRRKAHQMAAIFSGKLPCTGSFVVGGITEAVTAEKVTDFRTLLTEIRSFVDNIYLPDMTAIETLFPDYYNIGVGSQNLLSFGVFDLDASGTSKLLPSGRYTEGSPYAVDVSQITEYVTHSWYTAASGDLNPAVGITEPEHDKPGAYSWLKAPRYAEKVHEAGPLARMWVSGDYTRGISALDRLMARAEETKKVADTMDGWLDELVPGDPTYQPSTIPQHATGVGLTEAPRGALGHWMDVDNSVITRYQVVTPTAWNSSPKDHLDQLGPVEEALVGVPVADVTKPIEVIRVVHSFDPCLACGVHMVRPGERHGTKVMIRPGIA